MKEQVTDISKVLKGVLEEMQVMRETTSLLQAEVARLKRDLVVRDVLLRKKDKEGAPRGHR